MGIAERYEYYLEMQKKAHQAVAAKLERRNYCSLCGCKNDNLFAHHWAGYDEENWLNVWWVCPRANRLLYFHDGTGIEVARRFLGIRWRNQFELFDNDFCKLDEAEERVKRNIARDFYNFVWRRREVNPRWEAKMDRYHEGDYDYLLDDKFMRHIYYERRSIYQGWNPQPILQKMNRFEILDLQ